MKQLKRGLTLLFCLGLLCVLLPRLAAQVSAETYSGSCGDQGDNVSWTLDTNTGVLTISGTGGIGDYVGWAADTMPPWYDYCDNYPTPNHKQYYITTIIIEPGITKIGSLNFSHLPNLTSVSIPASVTEIHGGAFNSNQNLTSIVIPDSVTVLSSVCENGWYSFDCGVFEYCPSLQTVVIPDTLTEIGSECFRGCTSLTGFVLPNGLTMLPESCFYESGLVSITIPNTVTSIGPNCFYGCTNLQSISIPDSVTELGYCCFMDCTGLTSASIGCGVTSIGEGVFSGCSSLTSVSVDFETIDRTLLQSCYSIQNLTLGEHVKHIGGAAFCDFTNLRGIVFPDGLVSIGDSAFNGCTGLQELNFTDNITTIGISAFEGCTGLSSVIIPQSMEVIDTSAFKGCTNLTDITICNGNCQIEYRRDTLGDRKHTTIHGYVNSTAQYYARAYAYPFQTYVYEVPCPETAHDWGEWIEDLEPTCTDCGDEICACSKCGQTENRSVAALGHHYVDGICTVCGESDPNYFPPAVFQDVLPQSYYYTPVAWAYANHITTGISDTTFSPNKVCTRGQLMTFLWRASGSPEPESQSNPFMDVSESDYYYKAVLWAVEKGITKGTTPVTFSPGAACQRCQVVTFIWRLNGSPAPAGNETVFTDVPENAYYRNAVLWACEQGITSGLTDTSFGPGRYCTRAQAVTFLYRDAFK